MPRELFEVAKNVREPAPQPSAGTLRGWYSARTYIRHALKTVRRKSRQALGLALARLVGPRDYATSLRRDDVSSVMLCRVNGRIGNTMFLTASIRYLHELLPNASIDLVLAHPKSKELLGDLPGVRRVIVFPHKTPNMVWRYLAAVRALRSCRYDLAIDPTPESTSGRIALTLCRARYRLGFATRSQWAPLSHALPEPAEFGAMHQAVRPVYLLARIFGAPYEPDQVKLWLPLHEAELESGRQTIAQALARNPAYAGRIPVGFFSHAATFKVIDRDWWVAFWEAFLSLEPRAIPVEFLPSPEHEPVNAEFASVHVPSLRGVAAAISATRMFISTDTGPMHLASSTAVPTVGLFHASDPVLFRPLKQSDAAVEIAHLSPRAVAYRCQAIWREALRSDATREPTASVNQGVIA